MKLFSKTERYPEGEHAPETMPASCLGEACPNFNGTPCQNTFFEWHSAGATANEGRDPSRPPLKDEATYVVYGQVCLRNMTHPKVVAQKAEVYRPDAVNMMQFVGTSDRLGEMPYAVVIMGDGHAAQG